MDNPPVQLSCEQCRRRKKKCDKQTPCSACQLVGLECHAVDRARLPRGRSGKVPGRGSKLETRVARIEDLMRRLGARVNVEGVPTSGQSHTQASIGLNEAPVSNMASSFVAQDFWTELSQEVTGLRGVLEASDDEDVSHGAAVPDDPVTNPVTCSESILFNHTLPATNDEVLRLPAEWLRNLLLDTYQYRVDKVFKILHWPTALDSFRRRDASPHIEHSAELRALEFAIYFTATCSINGFESESMLFGQRTSLVQRFRVAAETALSKANLLQRPSLISLQAFVIYLLGLRACLACASTWTLLAIAVRIGNALRLDSDDPPNCSAFDSQLRRRVWYAIGLLDTQTALDRGSLPLMSAGYFKTPPLNINDSDMSLTNVLSMPPQSFTDMSFSCLVHEAMICQKKLLIDNGPQNGSNTWTDKVSIVNAFEESMQRQYPGCDHAAQPLQRYATLAAKDITTTMHLLLRRPPYKNVHIIVPEWDDFDLISVTTTVLERSMQKQTSSDFAPWSWFQWVRWYALAILLVELHSDLQGPSVNRAYSIAQRSFAQYAGLVADAQTGLLWKPIEKLMRRVQRLRGRNTNITSSEQPSDPTKQDGRVGPYASVFHNAGANASQIHNPPIEYQPNPFDQHTTPNDLISLDTEIGVPMFDANGLRADMDQLFDLEEKLPWLNWDVFLADVDSVTGMA